MVLIKFFQLLLIIAFVILLVYNAKPQLLTNIGEGFTNYIVNNTHISSSDVYNKNPGAMCDTMYYASRFLGDSDDTFQTRYCMSIPDNNMNYTEALKDILDKGEFAYDTITKNIFNMNEIRKDVERLLFNFQKGRKIQGPVFAIFTQAPYYLDKKGYVIYHQPYNQLEYTLKPQYEFQNPPQSGMKVVLHLIYPMYTKKRERYTDITDIRNHLMKQVSPFQELKTRNDLCRIHCVGDQGMMCGCLNTDTPYPSRCLGKETPNDTQDTQYTNYMMMYRVNEQSTKIRKYFTNKYIEDTRL